MFPAWLTSAGVVGVKPVLAALVLPPVPFIVLALAGAWRARAHPRSGRALAAVACVGLWLGACDGASDWVERHALDEPPALGPAERADLQARATAGESMAIVVLGGGVDRAAPEFGRETLNVAALARLRYGAWLSRETGVPLAASGGRGWAAADDPLPPEAQVMADAARDEFGRPLRWAETRSRDTHENAGNTVPMLAAAGVREIVVVTHGWHMPRAMREFRAAAAALPASSASGVAAPRIVAAPMGIAYSGDRSVLAWMPSGDGAQRMRAVLREVLASFADPLFQRPVASPPSAPPHG